MSDVTSHDGVILDTKLLPSLCLDFADPENFSEVKYAFKNFQEIFSEIIRTHT